MQKLHALILVSLFSIFLANCSSSEKPVKVVLTFISGTVTKNDKPVDVGDSLASGDTCSTSSKSLAVIQFDDKAAVLINSNTTIKIASLISKTPGKSVYIQQIKGSTFNKIIKNGLSYHITTSTLTAAVRGTSFSVYTDPVSNISRLKLIEGEIVVRRGNLPDGTREGPDIKPFQGDAPSSAQEVVLAQGFSIEGSAEGLGKPVQMSARQIDQFTVYKSISLIDIEQQESHERDAKKEEKPEIKKVKGAQKPFAEEIEKKILQMNETSALFGDVEHGYANIELSFETKLETIKKKNRGKLDIIKLNNGKELRGMIIERGPVYKIETPEGIRLIDRNDIVSQNIKI